MPTVVCPNCQDKIEIDPAWYGRRVACPSCDHRFTPRRPGDRDDSSPDKPYRMVDRPDDRDDEDDRPRRRSRPRSRSDADDRPRSGNKTLWVVLGVVGGLLFLGCAGCIGFVVYVNKAKQTFDGPWSDQSVGPGDAQAVTASFPSPPVTDQLTDATGGGNGSLIAYSNMDQGDSVKDAVVAVGYVEYPAGTANPLDKGYLPLRNELAERFIANPLTKPVVMKESTTNVGGYPAKEAVYSDTDGNFVLRVVHVNDRPRGSPVRLVVILAGGSGLKDADREKFLQSVKVGKGK